MLLKNKVLEILENNKHEAVSGEKIAELLNVSRNAVWKAVNSLKNDGFIIESVTKKGYTLVGNNSFTAESIKNYLNFNAKVEVFDSLNSTNDYLKNLAANGEPEGTIVVACNQTNGKGRLGRSFYSPNNTGVYFSVLLRPQILAEKSVLITTAAAVSVAKAVDKFSGNSSKIKWVNDIFLNGKKVCGILTEASLDLETKGLQYAVLGIGINLLKPNGDFPDDIKNIAGAVFCKTNYSNELNSKIIAETVNNFFEYYKNLKDPNILIEYKNKSLILGEKIYVLKNSRKIPAKSLDITENFGLVVEYENGETEVLNTGEISVRKAE